MKAVIALLFGLLTIPALADNTIVENLQELIETRNAITNAIVQKGGTVTSGALTNVPNEILSIPSGGGGDGGKWKTLSQRLLDRSITELTADDIGENVSIGMYAFAGMDRLTKITFPTNWSGELNPSAFSYNDALTEVHNVPWVQAEGLQTLMMEKPEVEIWFTDMTSIAGVEGMLYTFPDFQTLHFPSTVTDIDALFVNSGFQLMNLYLESVTPPAVTNLDEVEYLFGGCENLGAIHIPAGSVNAYERAPGWREWSGVFVGDL